jgi:hypothetical protein
VRRIGLAYNNIFGIEYPNEDDYYDINVINENISKIATQAAKMNKVVVAAYDSAQDAAKNADFVCKENESGTTLNKALLSVNKGGTLVLLEGTYNINESVVLNKPIKVVGEGRGTVLKQLDDDSETFNIFVVDCEDVYIGNMTMEDNDVSTSPKWLVFVKKDGAVIENVSFHFDYSVENDIGMVYFIKDCTDGIVRYCRFVRSFDTSDKEENFYDISIAGSTFCGVIHGNRRFENETSPSAVRLNFLYSSSYDYTAVSGQKTTVHISNKLAHSINNKQEA